MTRLFFDTMWSAFVDNILHLFTSTSCERYYYAQWKINFPFEASCVVSFTYQVNLGPLHLCQIQFI